MLILIPQAAAKPDTAKIDPHLASVVATALKPKPQPQPKDMTANFNAMIKQRAAAQAASVVLAQQEAAQAAQQAQALSNSSAPVQSVQTASPQPTNDAMAFIFAHESGNNPGAINASSGACGLGQALPCSKMPCSLSDYQCQVNFFTAYAVSRYGGWAQAQAFWEANNYW